MPPPKKKRCLQPKFGPVKKYGLRSYKSGNVEKPPQISIFDLNNEILCKILEFIPVQQLIKLELVSKHLRNAVFRTYHSVKELDLENFAYEVTAKFNESLNSDEHLKTISSKILKRFPNLEAISGIESFNKCPTWSSLKLLASIPKLKNVDFYFCHFKDADLNQFLLHCPNLTKLDLRDASIDFRRKKSLNSGFSRLEKLEGLDIIGLETNGNYTFLDALSSPALKNVNFEDIKSDQVAKFFRRFPNIQSVNIHYSDKSNKAEVFDALIQSSCKLHNLASYGMSHDADSYNHVIKLLTSPTCKNLKSLVIEIELSWTDRVVDAIVGNLPNLKQLRLQIKNDSLKCLKKLKHLSNLKLLHLQTCDLVTFPKGILSSWSASLSYLDTLILTNIMLENEELEVLTQFKKIHTLKLYMKKDLDYFVKICQLIGTQLRVLNIVDDSEEPCKNDTVTILLESCPNLGTLYLDLNLKPAVLIKIPEKCPKLEHLGIKLVSNYEQMEKNIFYLLKSCKHLKVLDLESIFLDQLWKNKKFHREFKHQIKLGYFE